MASHRSVLVTGASRGVGRGLIEYFANRGDQVFGCSRTPPDFCHERFRNFELSITDEKAISLLMGEIRKQCGCLDVLVNNAGVKTDAMALLMPHARADDIFATNVLGTIQVTRAALKLMKRNGFGRVINISSVAVPLASVGSSVYGASKAAIEQYARTLAQELAGDDITINTIGISIMAGAGLGSALSTEALSKLQASLIKSSPISIMEVAHVLEFFASDWAAGITNQIVYFGGVR